MEAPGPLQATVRGKDLPGAVKVMPLGLDAAIKKRVSGEFKSEKSGTSLTFSNQSTNQSISFDQTSNQSFQQKSSLNQMSSAKQMSSINEVSSGKQMSSFNEMSSMSKMSSSSMSSSKVSSMSSQMSSQKSFQQTSSSSMEMNSSQTSSREMSSKTALSNKSLSFQNQDLGVHDVHGLEIQQAGLKDQIYSAITDLEQEISQEFKENIPGNLKSPTPQAFSPQTIEQETFSPSPLSKDLFSPPPLEPVQLIQPAPFSTKPSAEVQRNARFTPEPVFSQMPAVQPMEPVGIPLQMMQNGFAEFSKNIEMKNSVVEKSFSQNISFEGSQLQESGSNSSLLQKIMTPAPVEYDTGSLKRRDPRKMFTDSSFYSAKHHPTVADQVEMAHKLTSALFKDENKKSKGQQMYMNRAQNAGEGDDYDDQPKHASVPNLKLVMNPEGKVHEWSDLDPSELPNAHLMAGHAAPSQASPDILNPVLEDMNSTMGKGETSVHRPNTFVSAYRRVFDHNRGVFGPGSPKMAHKNIDLNGSKDLLLSPKMDAKNLKNTTSINPTWSPKTIKSSPNIKQDTVMKFFQPKVSIKEENTKRIESAPKKESPVFATPATTVSPFPVAPKRANKFVQPAPGASNQLKQTFIPPHQEQPAYLTSPHLQSTSMTSQKLQPLPMTSQERQQARPMTSQQLQPTSLTSQKLQTAPLTSQKLQPASMTSQKLQTAPMTSQKLQTVPMTSQKLQAVTTISLPSSPSAPRRVPLSLQSNNNQNIVSFFENKQNNFSKNEEKIAKPIFPKTVDFTPETVKPAEILKTPFLLESRPLEDKELAPKMSTSPKKSNMATPKGLGSAVPLVDGGPVVPIVGFPQVSTSMVAKTKALFEDRGKENFNFVSLKKSRTFSSFPTEFGGTEKVQHSFPLSPSPPKRSSSRRVIADYQFKSLNYDLDQVGLDPSQAGSNRSSILDRSSVPDRSSRFTQRSSGVLEDFGKGRSLNTNMDSCGLDEAALNRRPLREFFH